MLSVPYGHFQNAYKRVIANSWSGQCEAAFTKIPAKPKPGHVCEKKEVSLSLQGIEPTSKCTIVSNKTAVAYAMPVLNYVMACRGFCVR